MTDTLHHRCLVCEPPLHATMWTTWPEATETDPRAVLATVGVTPIKVRTATAGETARFTGNELEAHRTLWLAFSDTTD